MERSTKPYLIRAIHEWACDSGLTPYISVKVDENTRVPAEYVKNGEIVLNIGFDATHKLTIGNDLIQFAARFGGVSRECSIPVAAVMGVFARENGQGLFFPPENAGPAVTSVQPTAETPPEDPRPEPPSGGSRPRLQVVK
jgi:stringent starvation protein B